jgi:hypothetical protein
MVQTDLAPGATKEIQAYMQNVPYYVGATAYNGNDSFDMTWTMGGPSRENFIIEWSEEENGSYTELIMINSSLTYTPESQANVYDFLIESGSPIKPGDWVRVSTYDGDNMGIFCEPVQAPQV